ncbi:hypothetical protein ACP3VV_15325, partial [Vibrio sp. PNB22_8_2]
KVGTPIGYSNDSQSPDYLFLPGFTSGNPSFTPNVSLDGEGFTYKFSTDRYNYLSVYGKDSTDATFANSVLMQGEDKLGISANTWNLVQQHLTTNDFTGSSANANGAVAMAYNNAAVAPAAGTIENRTLVNATHPYHLAALFEIYRHHISGVDEPTALKQQTIQLKNITFAWNAEEVVLPEEPQADLSGYTHSATLDLSQLNGQSGSALLQAIETQLNATLPAGAEAFNVRPNDSWANQQLSVVEHNGEFVLQTTIDAQAFGLPSAYINNGFSFLIELPNGLVREATMAYHYKVGTPIGYSNDSQSPDYLFLPGFTSGNPSFTPNVSLDGEGFTYKFSTDRYNYLSVYGKDSTDAAFANSVLMQGEDKLGISANTWNLVQQHLTANDFTGSSANANGAVAMAYNNAAVAPAAGTIENRTLVNATHPYHLAALFEIYRHHINGVDEPTALKQQTIQLKNITFAWNAEEVVLPEEPQADLSGYTHSAMLDLSQLSGQYGKDLLLAIEEQLNTQFPSEAGFKITPNWGVSVEASWDNINIEVVQENNDYVLQTVIDAEIVGKPSDINSLRNGVSFLVELPNGLVREATMAYHYKLGTPIGYSNDSQSPDYLFLPGFTSGNPSFTPNVSLDGEGFTYKFSTDRYNYLSVYGKDSTDATFANSVLMQGEDKLGISANTWNLVQQHLTANDFTGNTANANGTVEMAYNNAAVAPAAGAIDNRTLVNATHPYHLAALFEIYRHYKNGADQESDLKEQVIQLKNITFAWNEEEVALPTPENACSVKGFNHSRIVDLTGLEGADSQTISNAIASQLGNGNALFSAERNNLSVVSLDGGPVLKVTYGAGLAGKDEPLNGSSLSVDFPTAESLNSACIAYDIKYEQDVVHTVNNDIVILPSLHLKDMSGGNIIAEHNYVINHNKRLGTKFGKTSFLGWYDGSTKFWSPNTWSHTLQTMTFDPITGLGHLESLLNNATHFKLINNVEYNAIEYPIVAENMLGNVGVVASFDSYRPDPNRPGVLDQAFYFKNIAIGWK